MMWESWEVWRLAAAALTALLGVVVLREDRHDPSLQAAAFLLATVLGHLLAPLVVRHEGPAVLVRSMVLLALAVPFAFWLLTRLHFDDGFRFSRWQALPGVALVAVGSVCWIRTEGGLGDGADFWSALPKLMGLAFVVHGLAVVYAGLRTDLVLPRLKLRFGLLVLAGTYIFIELLGELALRDAASRRTGEAVHSVAVSFLVFVIAVFVLRPVPGLLKVPRAMAPTVSGDPALLERLQHLMDADQVFREQGLTIGGLARRLGAGEHTVRELINSRLGFRNFNALLNAYRIREAQNALRDHARAHLGVAQIAYEVGYASLGPFNRAFKEITGRTPTDFRDSSVTALAGQEADPVART